MTGFPTPELPLGLLLVVVSVAALQALNCEVLAGGQFTAVELKVAAVVLILIIAVPPTPSVPIAQVTVPLVEPTAGVVQLPCVTDAEVKVTWAGSGSDTLTPVATAGPLFVT